MNDISPNKTCGTTDNLSNRQRKLLRRYDRGKNRLTPKGLNELVGFGWVTDGKLTARGREIPSVGVTNA